MTLKLPPSGEDRWRLASHARVIVYETDDGNELLTVYDCGAAQRPPSAQVIGNLVRVNAAHELERGPTGYAVTMREPAELVKQDPDHYRIEAVDGDDDGGATGDVAGDADPDPDAASTPTPRDRSTRRGKPLDRSRERSGNGDHFSVPLTGASARARRSARRGLAPGRAATDRSTAGRLRRDSPPGDGRRAVTTHE